MLAAAKTRFRMSMSESELSAFEHGPIVAERDFASVESGPSTADLSLYNVLVNRATGKGVNLRVERMVKWRSHHPRNEPAATRDVASVQRFVIQITGHSALNILPNWPTEVEHDVRMSRASRVHGVFAERSARQADPATECLLEQVRPSIRRARSSMNRARLSMPRL